MQIRPSVLVFTGSEEVMVGQAVAAIEAEEYRPDVKHIRRIPIRPRQRLEVSGLSDDFRFLVRLASAPLPVLIRPENIKIKGSSDAEVIIKHYAGLLNKEPDLYLGYRR